MSLGLYALTEARPSTGQKREVRLSALDALLGRNLHSGKSHMRARQASAASTNAFSEYQVVADVCNANPQNDYNNCNMTLTPEVEDSRLNYCNTKFGDLYQCDGGYPADNGASECTNQNNAYANCASFT